jgi:acyl-coenzyme A thioesterase PaaI-like protein
VTDQTSGVGAAPPLAAFSQATAVHHRTAGVFDAEVSGEWAIGGRPNGGYLLAFLGRVATTVTEKAHVVAASAHYLRSPEPGPVEIEGELLRKGRSISQVRVRMSQRDRPCIEALMSTGDLESSTEPRWNAGVPEPRPVPFDDCVRLDPVTPHGIPVSLFEQVEARLEQESMGGITERSPSGRGEISGWLKLPGEEHFDPVSLLLAVDAMPPASFDTHVNAMVATIELTAYIRAIPSPGPVRIVSRARLIDSRCADETCDIWDSTGRLVAQATQLAAVHPG